MRPLIWKILLSMFVVLGLIWLQTWSQSAGLAAKEETAAMQDEKHPQVDFSISCLECHQDITPEITAEWSEGQHGLLNVGCFVCHGDGEIEYYPKPASDNCIGCHSAYEVDFTTIEATSCFSCHDGHDLKFHN